MEASAKDGRWILIHATPMTFGYLTWPLRPPKTSMILVAKATFDIVDRGFATLAKQQKQCHGPVFWDDDPEQSVRLDSDFALLKPAGECLLAGTCHPPTAPTPVSAVAFSVGPVQKGIGVFGDRHWTGGLLGKKPSEPAPFESMPLRWERAFGGPSVRNNPLGRGTAEIEGIVPLPNLESMQRPIASPKDAPAPAGAFPVPATWPERLEKTGTYDASWAEQRFPYLPVDFDPSFYFGAPADQRLRRRFWAGNEEISLRHLRPGQPFVRTRLPGLRPRGFIQRETEQGARFDEVPLVLDTITIDADAGQICCVWRGAAEVADDRLTDVERLFLMHDPIDSGRSAESCRERMEAHLRLRQLEESGFEPKRPEEDEEVHTIALDRLRKTMAGDPRLSALLEQVAARTTAGGVVDGTIAEIAVDASEEDEPEAPQAEPEPPPDAAAMLDGIFAQLAEQGMDLSQLRAQAEEAKAREVEEGGPDPKKIEEAFAKAGMEVPEEVQQVLRDAAEVQKMRAKLARDDEEDAPEPGLREKLLMAFAEGRPIEGDFTGVDVSGEDLERALGRRGNHPRGRGVQPLHFARGVLRRRDLGAGALRRGGSRGRELDRRRFSRRPCSTARASRRPSSARRCSTTPRWSAPSSRARI